MLKFEQQGFITKDEIKHNLTALGINYIDSEVDTLVNMLKFEDNTSEMISTLEIYANAHLFQLYPHNRLPLLQRIAQAFGATEQDLKHFNTFAGRVLSITELASLRNCLLYVDAEQSYIQRAIESVA